MTGVWSRSCPLLVPKRRNRAPTKSLAQHHSRANGTSGSAQLGAPLSTIFPQSGQTRFSIRCQLAHWRAPCPRSPRTSSQPISTGRAALLPGWYPSTRTGALGAYTRIETAYRFAVSSPRLSKVSSGKCIADTPSDHFSNTLQPVLACHLVASTAKRAGTTHSIQSVCRALRCTVA